MSFNEHCVPATIPAATAPHRFSRSETTVPPLISQRERCVLIFLPQPPPSHQSRAVSRQRVFTGTGLFTIALNANLWLRGGNECNRGLSSWVSFAKITFAVPRLQFPRRRQSVQLVANFISLERTVHDCIYRSIRRKY